MRNDVKTYITGFRLSEGGRCEQTIYNVSEVRINRQLVPKGRFSERYVQH